MAEPTPGRPGGASASSPHSATAATFQVNDASLKSLHTTWRMLIKDVQEFNKELQNLARGGKVVDVIAAKLGGLGVGRGSGGLGAGGRMPGMPPIPVHLGGTIPVGNPTYQPPLAGEGGVPRSGPSGGGAGTGGTPALAGGASPWKKAAGAAGLAAITGTAMFYQSRMGDISDSDLFFNQQAQNTGWGYRAGEKSNARNAMFGAPGGRGFGSGVTGYQSVQDLIGGAQNVFAATGGSVGNRGMAQLRAAGQLTSLTPGMGLAASGAAVGGLYDPTMSARLMSIGAGPSVGLGGQLQTPQAIYQRVQQIVFRGQRPTASMITQGLQPGAPLYVTLTQGLGLSPDQIEQFSRYAIAQANLGGSSSRVDAAMAAASAGKRTADTKLAGLDDSIRSGQNLAGGADARRTIEAGRESEDALKRGFRELANITDTLTNAFKRLNDMTGGASGGALGAIGLAGGPINSALNSVGGIGGSIFAAQGLKSLFARGGAGAAGGGGAGGAGGLLGVGRGALLRGGAMGAAGVVAGAGIDYLGRKTHHEGTAHILGDAARGAGMGAMIGSVVPGVGTAVGAGVGGVLGAGWGARHMLGFAEGGVVPGHHNRDDVDIKATPGEVVVPKNVVHVHGGADSLMRKLGFRGRGRDGHYASGGEVTGDTKGLDPEFLKRLKAWSAAVGEPFNVGSGYRSIDEQKVLYDRWMRHVPGQAKAAKPGSSNHNFGLAADGPHWRTKNPGKFGLTYPMSFEPWHVEPINAKAMRKGAPMAGGSSATDTPAGDGTEPVQTTSTTGNMAPGRPSSYADEKSAMAAFLSHAGSPYGVQPPDSPITSTSPKASGTDATPADAQVPGAPSDPKGNVELGKQKAAARGWTGREWDSLYNLFEKESGWRTEAANGSSSARGIAQTMMSVHFGKNWKTDKRAIEFMRNPGQQIDWGLNYIAQRYNSPSKAWAHSQKMNWYEKGAWETNDEVARLHREEMVVPAREARRLRRLVRDRGAQPDAGQVVVPQGSGGGVHVTISMPVQLLGKATQDDAEHLVEMFKTRLEQDADLERMGAGA